MLGIRQILFLGLGLLMLGGGVWDFMKARARGCDADMVLLSRWGSLAIIVFGIILLVAGMTQVFGNTISA